jgi:hypothetical protein
MQHHTENAFPQLMSDLPPTDLSNFLMGLNSLQYSWQSNKTLRHVITNSLIKNYYTKPASQLEERKSELIAFPRLFFVIGWKRSFNFTELPEIARLGIYNAMCHSMKYCTPSDLGYLFQRYLFFSTEKTFIVS